jgi:hypothetical protein
MSKYLILISCSNGKNRGGDASYPVSDSLPSQLSHDLCNKFYKRRRVILDLIKAGNVEDRLRGDGNRRDSRYNSTLQIGLDTSEDESVTSSLEYLPAYQRYDGRFYAHAGLDAFEKAYIEEYHVLIVSGLYGLLLLEEPIQAYNCHLDDDVVIDSETGADPENTEADGVDSNFRISDIWKDGDLVTSALKEYIQHHNNNCKDEKHRIDCVIDLLSETSYQLIFNWEKLHEWFSEQKISWFHRVVTGVREPGFLADLGRYFKNEILSKGFTEPSLKKIERDYLSTINEKGGSLRFTKEVQPDSFTENKVKTLLGDFVWNQLRKATRDELVHGELLYELYDAQLSTDDKDKKVPRIVNYFSAIENELYYICGKKGAWGTFGTFVHDICEGKSKQSNSAALCKQLKYLLEIRNRMSHRGVVTKQEISEVRELLFNPEGVLYRIVKLKQSAN